MPTEASIPGVGKDTSNLPNALNAADLLEEQADQFGDEHGALGNLRERLLPRIAALAWCLLAERSVMESESIGEKPTVPERPDWSAVGIDPERATIEMYSTRVPQEAGMRVAYPAWETGLYPERFAPWWREQGFDRVLRGLGGMMQSLLRARGSVKGRSGTILYLADLVTLYCNQDASIEQLLEIAEEQLVVSLGTYLRAVAELVAALREDWSWILDLPTASVA